MYKDDNKISRQQKVLHMNKCLNVCHIFKWVLAQESDHCLNGEITAEIDQLYTFGIFERKCGTWKHIDDLKKILMVDTSTKEN